MTETGDMGSFLKRQSLSPLSRREWFGTPAWYKEMSKSK